MAMRKGLRRTVDRRTLLRLAALGLAGAGALRATRAAASEQPEELDVYVSIPEDIAPDEYWVAVNLTEQAAVAMIGRENPL